MPLTDNMAISADGMSAYRIWMDVIASNLANADSTTTTEGGPFRRQMVVLAADENGAGVRVDEIRPDPSPFREVYAPGHPDADARGVVSYPNVQPARELVDMLNASRAYEANAVAMGVSKAMLLRALELGQR